MILISEGSADLEVAEGQGGGKHPPHDEHLEHFYSVSGHQASQNLLLSFSPADSGLWSNPEIRF
jgi:hypothetical protein